MKKVLLVAPVLSRSGYGEMGRFAFRSMLSNPNIDLYLHNISWGKTGWIWKDDKERKMIDSLLQKTMLYRQNSGKFDASVQCTIPNEWKRLSPHDVGYTAGIETDKVAPEWIVKGNEVDKIITISKHSMDVYKDTKYSATDNETGKTIPNYKCETPMTYVGFPTKDIGVEDLDLNLKHDFNFLCVAQMGPRKNVDAVINNFIEEFKEEDVGLLLKLNGANDSVMDYHNLRNQFQQITKTSKKEGWKCSINLLHGNLSDEQMHGLYQHPKVKAMVSFTHGEGFGLPIYEAAYNGLPVVATGWSGHLDFLSMKVDVNPPGKFKGGDIRGKITTNAKMFADVDYDLETIPQSAAWKGVLHHESKWANVKDDNAKARLRDVYTNYDTWKAKADTLKETYPDASYHHELFNQQLGIEFVTTEEEGVAI